jgi:hypothetical protein
MLHRRAVRGQNSLSNCYIKVPLTVNLTVSLDSVIFALPGSFSTAGKAESYPYNLVGPAV